MSLPTGMEFELDANEAELVPGSRYHVTVRITVDPADVLGHFSKHQLREYLGLNGKSDDE